MEYSKNWLFSFAIFATIFHIFADISNEPVHVNKCCEEFELYVGKSCTHQNETNETVWQPVFFNHKGLPNFKINFKLIIGLPDCGSTQRWPIYHYENSTDILRLQTNGVLRHYLYHSIPAEEDEADIEVVNGKDVMYYDYEPGKYCLDKVVDGKTWKEYALVCTPEHATDWTSTEFLMHNIINPISHAITIICLLIIAIIYFIMPTLCDLVGNIVTTISVCLILSQAADMTRLLTVFTNHVSFIITETICYISLLGAFFWLNSLGYYIWKTFKSRNVFLRITDGKKYCYYSAYAWSSTIIVGVLAVFAHFTMDYPEIKKPYRFEQEREEIGSLGMIIFFMPIAFSVIINVFFFASTLRLINRMNTYGRIHRKLKHSFRMFLLLFLIMTITWLFFLLSFSKYDALIYCYIIVNALQAPLLLYVCIFNQKHVAYSLRQTCCYNDCVCICCRPEPENKWGDEMTAMNTGVY